MPGSETAKPSSEEVEAEVSEGLISSTLTKSKDEEIEQWLDGSVSEADEVWPPLEEVEPGPEHDHTNYDLWEKEYPFPGSTIDEIHERLFHQVRDLLKYMNERIRRTASMRMMTS